MPKTAACRLCGTAFVPRVGGLPRYCEPCRARTAREISRVVRVPCKECGRAFGTASRVVRYCSDECRKNGKRRLSDAQRRRRRLARSSQPKAAGGAAPRCRVCGGAIEQHGGKRQPRVYCSPACRVEGMRAKNREYMRRYLSDPKKRALWSARSSVSYARRMARERGEG